MPCLLERQGWWWTRDRAPIHLNCGAYNHIRRSQNFRPLFADLEKETLYALYHKNDYPLIAKFQVQSRGERTNVMKYPDLDVKSVIITVYN